MNLSEARKVVGIAEKVKSQLTRLGNVYGEGKIPCPFRSHALMLLRDAKRIKAIVRGVVLLGLERHAIQKDDRMGCDCDGHERQACWNFEPCTYGTGGEDSYCAFHIASDLLRFGDHPTYHHVFGVSLVIPHDSVEAYRTLLQEFVNHRHDVVVVTPADAGGK